MWSFLKVSILSLVLAQIHIYVTGVLCSLKELYSINFKS